MKALASLILLTFLGSHALGLDLPSGEYHYSKTEAVSTKHFHRLYQNQSEDRGLISIYKEKGYICKRQNSHFTDCSRIISTNPNKIEFKTDRLAQLAPTFSETVTRVSELSNGTAVTIYEVEQSYATDSVESTIYKAYDMHERAFYLDLTKQKDGLVRFKYADPVTLTTFSYEKEKLNKKEYYRHGITSSYIKK